MLHKIKYIHHKVFPDGKSLHSVTSQMLTSVSWYLNMNIYVLFCLWVIVDTWGKKRQQTVLRSSLKSHPQGVVNTKTMKGSLKANGPPKFCTQIFFLSKPSKCVNGGWGYIWCGQPFTARQNQPAITATLIITWWNHHQNSINYMLFCHTNDLFAQKRQ